VRQEGWKEGMPDDGGGFMGRHGEMAGVVGKTIVGLGTVDRGA